MSAPDESPKGSRSHGPRATGTRIGPVDGMRALAALSILGYHVASFSGHTQSGAFTALASQLKAGVAVFFVISGFVLYLPYARAIRDRRSPWPDTRLFARRRLARIVPAYWTALTLWLALSTVAGAAFQAGPGSDWWRYFGFVQIYRPETFGAGLPGAWSLCVEISFYAMLPLLALGIRRLAEHAQGTNRRSPIAVQMTVIAILVLISIDIRLGLTGSAVGRVATGDIALAGSLPALLDWFAIGLALAVLVAECEAGGVRCAAMKRLGQRPRLCWLLAIALFAAAVPVQGGDVYLPLDGLLAHVAIGLGAGLLVLPAAMPNPDTAGSRILAALGHPVTTWLGTISYGIYLFHVPVLVELRLVLFGTSGDATSAPSLSLLPSLGLLAGAIVGAVALGAASWYLIERPAQRVFSGRRSRLELRPAVSPTR